MGSYVQVESMFSRVDNASKFADIAFTLRLGELNCAMIDAGFWPTDHLKSTGHVIIQRDEFLEILEQTWQEPALVTNWENLFANWDFMQAVKDHLSRIP